MQLAVSNRPTRQFLTIYPVALAHVAVLLNHFVVLRFVDIDQRRRHGVFIWQNDLVADRSLENLYLNLNFSSQLKRIVCHSVLLSESDQFDRYVWVSA